jgi:hypothetical protein
MDEYEIDLRCCIWRDCKGELVELESYALNNWITVVYRCTRCGREFSVKIEA